MKHPLVIKRFRFETAHRLPHHPGKCKHLHGHSYTLEVGVRGPVGENGMVVDFGDIKRAVSPLVEQWDHGVLLDQHQDKELADTLRASGARVFAFDGPPTAELMASYLVGVIRTALLLPPGAVFVRLYETADSWVEVEG